MTEIATRPPPHGASPPADADIVERVIAAGDLARLSPEERTRYYGAVCSSLGLNPLTKPFEYLQLSGRLVLYATRGATDQLRKIHHVSTQILSRETLGDVYVVTARATDREGRADESIGAVAIGGLKGDALCNQLMKAESKAKRRATLALVGLSFLDESEIETIPDARPLRSPEPPPAATGSPSGESPRMRAVRAEMDAAVAEEPLAAEVEGVPADDIDSLTGEGLADACDRLRRRLAAANVPYPGYPTPRTNRSLREWWWSAAALLEPAAAG
jgi:hypothetical protein